MNRTLTEAAVKRFYYDTYTHFHRHISGFVNAYTFGGHLKTFYAQPCHQTPGHI